jgi:uncharacterized protein
MGHRHSPTADSGRGALRASGSGIGAPAQRPGAEGLSRTARVLLMALRVYQTFFSALMHSACKFYPSCSQYAVEALQLHGARRGSWLALRRLSRCHPFTRGGVDLVPDAESFRGNAKELAETKLHEGHKGIDEQRSGDMNAGFTCCHPKSEVHS